MSVPEIIKDFRATYGLAQLGNAGTLSYQDEDERGNDSESVPQGTPFIQRFSKALQKLERKKMIRSLRLHQLSRNRGKE